MNYIKHAEQNAIINGAPERMKGGIIYIAGFEEDGSPADGTPCLLCRRMIQNSMIRQIVYRKKDGVIEKIDDVLAWLHRAAPRTHTG